MREGATGERRRFHVQRPYPYVIARAKDARIPVGGDGVEVHRVYVGSSAALAGLEPGDSILKIDTKRVVDVTRFIHLITTSTPEAMVGLKIARGGRISTELNFG